MWISKKKYNSLLRCLNKAIDNNFELRKVCQCRQCKWGRMAESGSMLCINDKSIYFDDFMRPFGSCEKCERR